jgi:trehalose/maltose hydrolase-like predicted phosphorylase
VLRFDPRLPPQVTALRFSVHYRRHRVELAFTEDRVQVGSRPGTAAPITVRVREESVELAPGGHHVFRLDGG